MSAVDLCPEYKVFVDIVRVEYKRIGGEEDEEFARRIIGLSKSNKEGDYWIPAISFNDKMWVADGIKVISDGRSEMFV
jgi:hypothetical protein